RSQQRRYAPSHSPATPGELKTVSHSPLSAVGAMGEPGANRLELCGLAAPDRRGCPRLIRSEEGLTGFVPGTQDPDRGAVGGEICSRGGQTRKPRPPCRRNRLWGNLPRAVRHSALPEISP